MLNKNSFQSNIYKVFIVFIGSFLTLAQHGYGQYFNGPNKPDYKIFEYKVLTSPHFELYHYLENDSVKDAFMAASEKWYERHFMIFSDTFKEKNPVIVYANHADFQQTNAVSGLIGVGTGGVTESLKNRVIMPVMESAAQTDHVLGHELVHAFQYNFLLSDDSLQLRNMRNIPLWMIEGMAEYLSIGSTDPLTAMWMRDAILNNDFPSLDDMSRSYKYFPYRYGQAFWAFVTGYYGDTIIKPLFDLTTKYGYDKALETLTIWNERTFSQAWKNSMQQYYSKYIDKADKQPTGTKILHRKNSGAINIAPSLSPDGKYVIFLSEKDLFTFDLFMADAKTGKIVKKVSSTIRQNQIDDFNFLESGGAWSPDGKKFAFVTFSQGRNRLMITDIDKPRNTTEIDLKIVDAFSNPAWSPDGKSIVVTGLKEGVTDLYSYQFDKDSATRLTNDVYCNLMSSWSKDGRFIVYSTDRPAEGQTGIQKGYALATFNVQTKEIKVLPVFLGAENLNAQIDSTGDNVYFLSDADGIRNLYHYNVSSNETKRLSNAQTGVCGVTPFTPALTMNHQNIIYTYYWNGDYNLYKANINDFKAVKVNPNDVNFDAATLPPFKRIGKNIVNINLGEAIDKNNLPRDSIIPIPYRSKFQLDYIGGSNVGVSAGSYYGTGMSGSVDMLFGDVVGNYQLYTSLAINGQIQDFGGSVAFINNKNKIDWGSSLSHIPYKYGNYYYSNDSVDGDLVSVLNVDMQWIFENSITLFAIKPLSQNRRIEASISYSYYNFYLERDKYVGSIYGYSTWIGREKNLPTDKGFGIASVSTSYTLDNSYMGIASPLRGQRFRVEVDQYVGKINFTNLLIDYRKYFFINPYSFAFRLYHQGRYGNVTTNNVIRSLYLGWPWLVRGFYGFIGADSYLANQTQLFGSRLAIANAEFRIPFTGPERLCLIPFKYFVSELSFFADAGVAWSKMDQLTLNRHKNERLKVNYKNLAVSGPDNMFDGMDENYYRYPLMTYGISLRINLFGVLIIEPYYSIPYMKDWQSYAGLNLNLFPGW